MFRAPPRIPSVCQRVREAWCDGAAAHVTSGRFRRKEQLRWDRKQMALIRLGDLSIRWSGPDSLTGQIAWEAPCSHHRSGVIGARWRTGSVGIP